MSKPFDVKSLPGILKAMSRPDLQALALSTYSSALAEAMLTTTECVPCQERSSQTTDNPDNLASGSGPAPAPEVFDQEDSDSDSDSDSVELSSTTWTGVIGVEGHMTGDGRLIESNALRWENGPWPIRYVRQDVGFHDGAETVGRITRIWRAENGDIMAEGDFDVESEAGREAARVVGNGVMTGVSMDLDDVSFEVRIAQEYLDQMEEVQAAPDQNASDSDDDREVDEDNRVTVVEIASDDEVRVTTSARIRAATLVSIPAFDTARIALDSRSNGGGSGTNDNEDSGDTDSDEPDPLVASGAINLPDVSAFSDPQLSGPTALTVTEDGRVYGHLALWGTCHTGQPHGCVTPPHSSTDYAYFHTGALTVKDGSKTRELAVGRLTMDTKHAPTTGARAANAHQVTMHYEDTGLVAAFVRAGEDAHGIWVSGVLRSLPREKVDTLKVSPLSGDWRRVAGNLELVAALAVNMPGFPVPRPSGLVASGHVQALVASGMVAPSIVRVEEGGQSLALADNDGETLTVKLSKDQARRLDQMIDRERKREAEHLAARVRRSVVDEAARKLAKA